MAWSTSDIKEEAKIYDLRRLDSILVAIDRISQKIREVHLKEQNIGPLLAEYISFLEVLWKNLLRPKTTERKFDKTFEKFPDKKKTPGELFKELRKLNDDLYEMKESIRDYNTKIKRDYDQDLTYPELVSKNDKGNTK